MVSGLNQQLWAVINSKAEIKCYLNSESNADTCMSWYFCCYEVVDVNEDYLEHA